jgi:hypothetical protein
MTNARLRRGNADSLAPQTEDQIDSELTRLELLNAPVCCPFNGPQGKGSWNGTVPQAQAQPPTTDIYLYTDNELCNRPLDVNFTARVQMLAADASEAYRILRIWFLWTFISAISCLISPKSRSRAFRSLRSWTVDWPSNWTGDCGRSTSYGFVGLPDYQRHAGFSHSLFLCVSVRFHRFVPLYLTPS